MKAAKTAASVPAAVDAKLKTAADPKTIPETKAKVLPPGFFDGKSPAAVDASGTPAVKGPAPTPGAASVAAAPPPAVLAAPAVVDLGLGYGSSDESEGEDEAAAAAPRHSCRGRLGQ